MHAEHAAPRGHRAGTAAAGTPAAAPDRRTGIPRAQPYPHRIADRPYPVAGVASFPPQTLNIQKVSAPSETRRGQMSSKIIVKDNNQEEKNLQLGALG